MTRIERRNALRNAAKVFGVNFFMVDARDREIKAAPFHIQTDIDKKVFIEHASDMIPWMPIAATKEVEEEIKRKSRIII